MHLSHDRRWPFAFYLGLLFTFTVLFSPEKVLAQWGGWETLGGIILEQPECVSWGENRIDCFARGGDSAMYHRWWDGSQWGGWETLGGVLLNAPSCTSWGENRIDCFARGDDSAMYHRWWDGSQWGGWETLGGIILEQPECVSWGENRIDCFARGGDSAMYHRWWPCPSCAVTEHRLQARRFTTASLSNADADRILPDATTVLQTNDGPGDTACDVAFSRDGDVTVFPDGDGSIDSQAEFNTLIALPGWVKVVNQINWCGALLPNVIGCAPVPGNSLAVVRITANQEGILWAHEFGHNQGRNHRNDDPNAVMNGTIGDTHRRVNSAECDAYRTAPATALVAHTVLPQVGGPGLMDVRDFVRQVFIHGVPYEEATKYDSSVVPMLLNMLKDPAEEAHWSNIVVVLGMIGDERAVDALISFIEANSQGSLSREHYRAKTSALMALGYLINKTGNQKALNYLKQGVAPETWTAKGGAGIAPFQASTTERNRDFSKHAILGLALSGHPEAAQALRALQQPTGTNEQRAFKAQVSDLVLEALNEHQKISSQGLAKYYQTTRP